MGAMARAGSSLAILRRRLYISLISELIQVDLSQNENLNLILEIIKYIIMNTIPNTFNPSDYQYLLKSISEGNMLAKSQSLKRFNTLVTTDKKQFSVYAKRIVLTIQNLMNEPKEDINLLASMLSLEIINLNPKDIEYYIRTKLMKHIVANLGNDRPQVRKTSHYCLLGYLKTYKSFDQLIPYYIETGINSLEAQLRQKSINSFQSLFITEINFVNWSSQEMKKLIEILLHRLRDESLYVQKASQQCLLTMCKMDEINIVTKKLNSNAYNTFKIFVESQREIGNLNDVKMETREKVTENSLKDGFNRSKASSNKGISQSILNLDKINIISKNQTNKQAMIQRIQEIRKTQATPKLSQQAFKIESKDLKKQIELPQRQKPIKRVLSQINVKEIQVEAPKNKQEKKPQLKYIPLILSTKPEKIEDILGRKLLDDLKNQKDWKVRLEAVQELQTKLEMCFHSIEIDSLIKNFVPIILKLLADQNFKIALISLKIVEDILKFPKFKIDTIVPQIVQKLNDGKIALRQNVNKLIRRQFFKTGKEIWINQLLENLQKSNNSAVREEILGILTKFYEQKAISVRYERVIEAICPLMDDPKTKIKIRTLDLLVLISIKTMKIDSIKSILMEKLNQVYYEMFLEKVTKEIKLQNINPEAEEKIKEKKNIAFPLLKNSKNSVNTTSSSINKNSMIIHTTEVKASNRTRSLSRLSAYTADSPDRQKKKVQLEVQNISSRVQTVEMRSSKNSSQKESIISDFSTQTPKIEEKFKKPFQSKSYKKKVQKVFESKLLISYAQNDNLQPLNDPQREIKNIQNDIKLQDWEKSSNSMTKLRRILKYHQEYLTPNIAKSLVPDIMKHVESLRSSLSKNAVLTISDLSNVLLRNLDSQIEIIYGKLLRKTLDANSFISEQVKKALITISINTNQHKIISLLVNYHSSKALPIKNTVAQILETITFIPRIFDKEKLRIINICLDFMNEGSLEIREKTKGILAKILKEQKSTGQIYKMIPQDIISKVLKIIPKIEQKVNEKIEVQKTPPKQIQPLPKEKSKKLKITVFPNEFNSFDELLVSCQNNQWKMRIDSIAEMGRLCTDYPEEISQYRGGSKVMDCLSKKLNDPNYKVAAVALKWLGQIVVKSPQLIERNLATTLSEIFTCFSNPKAEIRQKSILTFETVYENIQKWMMVQHLCSGALYAVHKSRPTILVKLLKVLSGLNKKKLGLISRNVCPMINKVADENKAEFNPILKELILLSAELVGEDVYSDLKSSAKQLISQ